MKILIKIFATKCLFNNLLLMLLIHAILFITPGEQFDFTDIFEIYNLSYPLMKYI